MRLLLPKLFTVILVNDSHRSKNSAFSTWSHGRLRLIYLLANENCVSVRTLPPTDVQRRTRSVLPIPTRGRGVLVVRCLVLHTPLITLTHNTMTVILLPIHLCNDTGIHPKEVMVCDATDTSSSTCSIYDDDERSDTSDASTCMLNPTCPNKSLELRDVPLHLRPTGGIKDPKRFKTTFCDKLHKLPRCPFGHKCQHAHSQEEIDFWNKMRMIGSHLVRF